MRTDLGRRHRSTRNPLATGLVWLVVALFALPLAGMVSGSFKSPLELAREPHRLLPATWQPQNYADALRAMPFGRYLRNTLVLCGGTVLGTLVSCSLAAYGFARLRWRGRQACFAVLIATMLLPWHVTMVPKFLLLRELGLYNSLAALILPRFLGDGFYIFLLRQFFRTIPEELSEAARLDGLSEWGIYWRIVWPLSSPALITVALFQFVATWNDFQGPLLYLSDPQHFPLAYGLEQFLSAYADQTHLLLAASVLFMLPVLVLFLAAQRVFLGGIATSGLKQ